MKALSKYFLFTFIIALQSCNDSSIEPETQFVQIFFKYGFKNELNTFGNTYQKDLVMDGVVKVQFWLTTEEQNKIIEKAHKINFFSMPDTFVYRSEDSIRIIINPDPGPQILRIKYNQSDKRTTWMYPPIEDDTRFKDLLELQELIISIIESKKEYQNLPAARGGYD